MHIISSLSNGAVTSHICGHFRVRSQARMLQRRWELDSLAFESPPPPRLHHRPLSYLRLSCSSPLGQILISISLQGVSVYLELGETEGVSVCLERLCHAHKARPACR